MHRWGRITAGGETLYVGANNYAFPIPLDRDAAGRWSFDTAAGRDELLARRIGNNELAAIAALGGIADAQRQYAGRPRDGSKGKEYARRFVSAPGTQDGLYWPASAGTTSPLASLADLAQAAGKGDEGGTPEPFNGYAFRILTKQGNTAKSGGKDIGGRLTEGFAVVAYPVDYRNSGIMTFMIGTDGIVYQKDLGEKTTDIGSTMTEYNPRDGWAPVITGEQTSATPDPVGRVLIFGPGSRRVCKARPALRRPNRVQMPVGADVPAAVDERRRGQRRLFELVDVQQLERRSGLQHERLAFVVREEHLAVERDRRRREPLARARRRAVPCHMTFPVVASRQVTMLAMSLTM